MLKLWYPGGMTEWSHASSVRIIDGDWILTDSKGKDFRTIEKTCRPMIVIELFRLYNGTCEEIRTTNPDCFGGAFWAIKKRLLTKHCKARKPN